MLCHACNRLDMQGVKVNGILPAGQVLSALEALVAQPNSTAVKEYEVRQGAVESFRGAAHTQAQLLQIAVLQQ